MGGAKGEYPANGNFRPRQNSGKIEVIVFHGACPVSTGHHRCMMLSVAEDCTNKFWG